MDFTYTDSPYNGRGIVGTIKPFKESKLAAKMNEDASKKVTMLRKRWEKNRPEPKTVQPVKTITMASPQVVETKLQKLNMQLVPDLKAATRNKDPKKIKVNEIVVANVNNANVVGPKSTIVPTKPLINDTVEVFKENQLPEVKEDVKIASIKQDDIASHTESPIEVTKQNAVSYSELLNKDTNVINTPSRFATNQPEANPMTMHREARPNALPSRMERRSNDYASLIDNSKNIEVGKEEAVLNKIASLNHGNVSSSSSASTSSATTLEEAILEYNKTENTMRETIDNIKKLEADYKKTETELKQKQAKQIAEIKAQTEAKKEEILGLTMYEEDLQRKIEEMKKAMASGESVSFGKLR